MPNVAASADQLAAMRGDASDFQAYVLGPASKAVLGRYAFWQELTRENTAAVAERATLTAALEQAGIVELIQANNAADDAARAFADVVGGLNAGTLELAHHMDAEQGSGPLTLGVANAGAITLGLWPIVPLIVTGAIAAGVWVLVNAWLSVRTLEAQSDALRAKTSAAVTAAVARAGAQSPQAAALLADALERANNAANNVQPSLLDKLERGAREIGGAVRDDWSWLLLLLGGAWLLSNRKGART